MRDGDLSPQRDFFSNFAKATIGARPWGPFLFFFFLSRALGRQGLAFKKC